MNALARSALIIRRRAIFVGRDGSRGSRPRLDPWVLLLAGGPAVAVLDTSSRSGILLSEPGDWSTWWWAAPVWILQIAPLVWRRRYPIPVLAATATALVIGQALVPIRTLADVSVLVAAYSVAAFAARRAAVIALAAGGVAWTLALVSTGTEVPTMIAAFVVLHAGPVAFGLAARGGSGASSPATVDAESAQRTPTGSGRLPPAAPSRAESAPLAGLDVLSPREREVLALVADGLNNQEVAERLYVSRETVKSHVAALLAKLQCRNRVQLVVLVRGPATVSPQPS